MEQVLLLLNPQRDDRILVGQDHYDDAVVVQINATTTLVQTVDFFTPVVDNPYDYGRIAAANSLSDVYAMGGTPVTAMNIVCFPTARLGPAVLAEILRGGGDALREAGVMLAGGHTVEDDEPKFGLAVTGIVDPARVTTKGGIRPGDHLYLTKPIGTGVVTTAHKKDGLSDRLLADAVRWMSTLNDRACRAMLACGCRGATDITGFGLLGHAGEMSRASGVQLVMEAGRVPLLESVLELRQQGFFPGGSAANRRWIETRGTFQWADEVPEPLRDLLCDAQTSGGLLVALAPEQGERFQEAMEGHAWRVGSAREGAAGILVSP